jgi:hypothetical protein
VVSRVCYVVSLTMLPPLIVTEAEWRRAGGRSESDGADCNSAPPVKGCQGRRLGPDRCKAAIRLLGSHRADPPPAQWWRIGGGALAIGG